MQLVAVIVSLTLIAVGLALFCRALLQIFHFIRLGQPVPTSLRTNNPYSRTVNVVREFLGHTRMNRWGVIGFAHWFVAIGFYTLLQTIVNAVGQLFQADWVLPVIGDWAPYNVFVEFIGTMTVLGILVLIAI
ncbi:Fe-S oxidoreductase, partial [Streptomyces pseudovenezuelae]